VTARFVAAIGAIASIVSAAASAAACPATGSREAAACGARAGAVSAPLCAAAARQTEQCADRSAGVPHATYLARAGAEWAQAGIAAGRRSARGRTWLAHALVLDERVQDDPDAPRDLRRLAKRNEDSARTALFGARPEH
jgi:hypothetical protein